MSHTTRKPRQGEEDGVHYNFTSKEAFQKGIDNNDFVEFASLNGNLYGTSYRAIDDVSKQNLICILEIDVQGADIVKQAGKLDANYLFITAEGGIDTLKQRLEGRQTETEQQIKQRLDTAAKELAFLDSDSNQGFFGRVISNDDLALSVVTLVQQFKTWYPWLITDRLVGAAASSEEPNDDDKSSSVLNLSQVTSTHPLTLAPITHSHQQAPDLRACCTSSKAWRRCSTRCSSTRL